jgi:uncharacterized SAM-binding protein YcdF (DUF218 family)
VLKSALETIALPPVCFLYLALLGPLIARRRRGTGLALLSIGLFGLTMLSLPVVADSLLASLERDLPLTAPADAMPQAIVILGGDVSRTNEPPFARNGRLTLDRLRTGAILGRQTGLPILVTGGIVQQNRPAVGTLMAASLSEDFRVPVTWVEDASVDTWENALLSARILRTEGIRSVYLVTQAWHMRRAVMAFRRAGMIVTAMPTALEPPFDPIVSDFFPHAFAWELSFYALHEWIGCAWYAIR